MPETQYCFLNSDIDECSDTSYAHANGICINTIGGWDVKCDPGYMKAAGRVSSNKSCTGKKLLDNKHRLAF